LDLGAGEIQFATGGTTISEQSSDLIFDVSADDFFSFDIAGTPEYTFNESQADFKGNILFDALIDGDLNTIVDINETQLTVATGTIGFVLTSTGEGNPPTYQVTGAAGQTPWGSDIDGDGFNLFSVGEIQILDTVDNTAGILSVEATHTVPADGQLIGQIDFIDDDSSNNRTTYSQIRTLIQDGSNTTESGEMILSVIDNGSPTDYITLNLIGNNRITFNVSAQLGSNNLYFENTNTGFSQSSSDIQYDVVTGGSHLFQINLTTALQVTEALGSLVVGTQAALATTETDGFLYIPSMAGVPTGDSTDFTGKFPIVWDSTGSALYINTSGATWLEIGGGGGSQTPWLSDIDAANFSLDDLDHLAFDSNGTTAGAGVANIFSGAGGITINVPDGDVLDLTFNGIPKYTFSSTVLDGNNTTSLQGFSELSFDNVNTKVEQRGSDITLSAVTAGNVLFFLNDADEYKFNTLRADWFGNDLENMGILSFAATTQSIFSDANSMTFDLPTGDEYRFKVNSTNVLNLSGASADFDNIDVWLDQGNFISFNTSTATQKISADGDGLIFELPTGDGYDFQTAAATVFEIADDLGSVIIGTQAALATTETDGFLYLPSMAGVPTGNSTDFTGKFPIVWDSTGSALYINTTGTTWVEIGGGGSQTPWLSDIDAANFSLDDLDHLAFDSNGTTAGAAIANIFSDTAGITLNVPDGDNFDIDINGALFYRFTANSFLVNEATSKIILKSGGQILLDNNTAGFVSSAVDTVGIFAGNFTPKYTFNASEFDLITNDIVNVGSIDFGTGSADTGTIKLPNAATIEWEASPVGTNGTITYNSAEQMVVGTGASDIVLATNTTILKNNTTATFQLEANHTSPMDGQEIGRVQFIDDDDGAARTVYGQITTLIEDPTAAGESGEMFLSVIDAGTLTDYISLNEANNKSISFDKDVVMNTHNITGVSILQFSDDILHEIHDNADSIFVDVPMSDSIVFRVATDPEYTFAAGTSDWTLNNLTSMGILSFTDTDTSLQQDPITPFLDLQYDVATGGSHLLRVGNDTEYTFNVIAADFGTHDITNVANLTMTGDIALSTNQQIIWATSTNRAIQNQDSGFFFKLETGDTFKFQINPNDEYDFDAAGADWHGNNLSNVGVLNLLIDGTPAVIELEANHTPPTNGEVIGQINFIDNDNDVPTRITYGQIRTVIEDPTTTQEDAEMFLGVVKNGSIKDYLSFNSANVDEIGAGATLNMSSEAILGITNITLSGTITGPSAINDTNGESLLIFTPTVDAVNELTLVNAATLTPVELQATGDDANVDVRFTPKGTGTFYGNRETWAWPLTDETTAPTTGVKYTTEPAPYDMAIEDAITGLTTAGTGAALFTIDVLKEDSVNANTFTTIFSTLPTIDASEFTSTTADTAPVISVSTWEKGRRLQLSIDTLDTDGLARGAKISLITHATAK